MALYQIKCLPVEKAYNLVLAKKNGIKNIILDFNDVFFLSNSLCNLINLILLNNHKIFYNNKNKTLYDLDTKEVLTQVK